LVKFPKGCYYDCQFEECLLNGILYGGHLSLEHQISSFELPVFLYQKINLIAIAAWTIGLEVLLGMVPGILTACGCSQVTRVLGPNMRKKVL
jgi:hypothetical protein